MPPREVLRGIDKAPTRAARLHSPAPPPWGWDARCAGREYLVLADGPAKAPRPTLLLFILTAGPLQTEGLSRCLDAHILLAQELRLVAGPALSELETQLAAEGWVGSLCPGLRAAEGGVSAGTAALARKHISAEVPKGFIERSRARRSAILVKTAALGRSVGRLLCCL